MKQIRLWTAIASLALFGAYGAPSAQAAPGAMGLLEECRASCAGNGWREQRYESLEACHDACLISVGLTAGSKLPKGTVVRDTAAECKKGCADATAGYSCLNQIERNLTVEMSEDERKSFTEQAKESCRIDAVRKCELTQCSSASVRDPKVAGARGNKRVKDRPTGGSDVVRTTDAGKPN